MQEMCAGLILSAPLGLSSAGSRPTSKLPSVWLRTRPTPHRLQHLPYPIPPEKQTEYLATSFTTALPTRFDNFLLRPYCFSERHWGTLSPVCVDSCLLNVHRHHRHHERPSRIVVVLGDTPATLQHCRRCQWTASYPRQCQFEVLH